MIAAIAAPAGAAAARTRPVVVVKVNAGFHWLDAGLGAAAGVAASLAALGLVLTVRQGRSMQERRRT